MNNQASDSRRSEVESTGSPVPPEVATLEPDEDLAVATCRVCGCADEQACDGGCSWVPDPAELGDLCSGCLPLVRAVRDGIRAELRVPPVTVNVNLTIDASGWTQPQTYALFEGLRKVLREAGDVQ